MLTIKLTLMTSQSPPKYVNFDVNLLRAFTMLQVDGVSTHKINVDLASKKAQTDVDLRVRLTSKLQWLYPSKSHRNDFVDCHHQFQRKFTQNFQAVVFFIVFFLHYIFLISLRMKICFSGTRGLDWLTWVYRICRQTLIRRHRSHENEKFGNRNFGSPLLIRQGPE